MLITTNSNINALRFWQKRGFRLVHIYLGALEESRKLKPIIPLIDDNGIPIREEQTGNDFIIKKANKHCIVMLNGVKHLVFPLPR
jgi:hypothetical protein